MQSSFRQTIIATTAILGLTAFAAVAATPPAADPAAAPTTAKTQPAGAHNRAENIAQRLTDLHAQLNITPAQQVPWDQFTAVMRENAQMMAVALQQRSKVLPTMTAAENMQSHAEIANAYAQEMGKLVPAFQAVYATMSDTQKHTADQVFRDGPHRPHHG